MSIDRQERIFAAMTFLRNNPKVIFIVSYGNRNHIKQLDQETVKSLIWALSVYRNETFHDYNRKWAIKLLSRLE